MPFLLMAALVAADAATLHRRGVELFEAGKAAEAIPALEQAANLDPRKATYWKAVGVARASLQDYRGASGPFEKACRLDRQLADACYYAGRALYAADRYREALPLLRLDGGQPRSLTAQAECHEALGELAEAERLYRAAVAQGAPPVAYGRFLVRAGRPREADQALEKQTDSDALYWRALALSHLDRVSEAVALLEQSRHPAADMLRKRLSARLPPR